MKKILSFFLMLPLLGLAQEVSTKQQEHNEFAPLSPGISWTEGLSWNQVKAKAKQENKYIFLDCYTTWCGPCKMMDAQVYPNDSVGEYFNSRFISVRVQMDKTKNDNDWVKSWYKDAEAINTQYKIEGYPSFLFFSPDGKIVNSSIGAILDINKFIAMGQTATKPGQVYIDPYSEYFTLVADYKKGIILYDSLHYMIKRATRLNDYPILNDLISSYIKYMSILPADKRYTRRNIRLWTELPLDSKSQIFQYFYQDSRKIDKVMNQKYFAAEVINKVIHKEIVVPFFEEQNKNSSVSMKGMYVNGENPPTYLDDADWNKLKKRVQQQYNKQCAERSVLTARIEWYNRLRNYKAVAKYTLLKLERYPVDSITDKDFFMINDYGWYTFLYVTNKDSINKAIYWVERALKRYPKFVEVIDTYASLLYKSGRKMEAIQWEEKAVALSNKKESIIRTLEQMKNGEKMKGVVWDE